ncbi:MAG: HAMP domain-containing histidine kinase [Candidatus Cloacimonetes bacterium]|jgi:signal transduction histidine kinase|nr:HAMP domain-containing histidine kinase [Candidatus Cloacimonadota bacterium]MCB5286993.1 HAMP domain-containing histidine kinase [Candidatus Cloacimonadota bacterium]MCK9183851.1 HAMP domain-containing histidine kinase [Candidatus Cloacimonadota bacterium]MCK9583919.1 HAMP domain-containing histidine kinase [Candidatus Cloacimonadota bacterium]MDY0229313.1 HAMP domain-containing sensor histidine kinase [Candidatus Cloacimonadaceae bacterium]
MKHSSIVITGTEVQKLKELILDGLEKAGLQIGEDYTIHLEETDPQEQLEIPKEISSYYFNEMSQLNNDLTNMQRELAKANAGLNKLVEIRNRFVGMAAHDLRNPIGIIRSFSEYLIAEFKTSTNTDTLEVAKIIHSTAIFMQRLVDGILDVSSMQSGTVVLNTQKVDLNQLFEEIVNVNKILAKAHEIKILYLGLDAPVLAEIDHVKIRQVINNLINNSVKYSPDGSTITCRSILHDACFHFYVQDEGPGIAKEDQSVIFEPFKRLSNNEGRQKSVGLGLSIAKNIISAHGGDIWVESEAGHGAKFCFSLPINIKSD